jgi:hypothetical protein
MVRNDRRSIERFSTRNAPRVKNSPIDEGSSGAMLPRVKIGEWDSLGRARGLVQRQLGELGAAEYAAHVTVNPDNGRLRVFVATDAGLLDYQYAPMGPNVEGTWILRGQLVRWGSVRGLRLQTDAQQDEGSEEMKAVWRLVSEDPKMELTISSDDGGKAIEALAAFARACIQHAG